MKKKKLPNNKHKGLVIYCSNAACKKYFSWTQKNIKQDDGNFVKMEPLCGISKKRLSACKHQNNHKYVSKIHIPGSGDKKVSKTLKARSYPEAVIEAVEFENEFKSNLEPTDSSEKISKRYYLFDCQLRFIQFLENVGVPEHKKVKRSEKYIKEISKDLLLFNKSLTKNKINKKLLPIDRVNDDHVGYFHNYLLKDKSYENRTYNNKMGSLRRFFEWATKTFQLQMVNPFDDVRERSVVIKKDTITQREFKALLDIISPENGHTTTGIKNPKPRNRYMPYLKDGIELALHTGGRREEITELKWNMVHTIEGVPAYIEINNFKVERQLGQGFNDNVNPKIIPITKSLLKLLHRMGYEKKKGRDEYLLSPDRSGTSAYAIMDNLSKGFSHFYKQLNTGRELQLKSLRKTYLTYLNSALSGDTKSLTSHATDEILQKHYIDERIVNKAVKELSIFNA